MEKEKGIQDKKENNKIKDGNKKDVDNKISKIGKKAVYQISN